MLQNVVLCLGHLSLDTVFNIGPAVALISGSLLYIAEQHSIELVCPVLLVRSLTDVWTAASWGISQITLQWTSAGVFE